MVSDKMSSLRRRCGNGVTRISRHDDIRDGSIAPICPPQEYLKRGRNRVRRCIGVVCSAAKCCLWSTLLRRQTMFVTTATLCYQPRQVAAPCNASRGITCQVVVFVDVEESQWVRAISFTYLTACSSFTNSPSQCCIATVVYMIQMQADVHCM